jgi:hypothetical protein
MSVAMTTHAAARALLTRIGNAIGPCFDQTAVRRDISCEDAPTPLLTTVDQWTAEEQWLAGFPGNRSERFGWLWCRGP